MTDQLWFLAGIIAVYIPCLLVLSYITWKRGKDPP